MDITAEELIELMFLPMSDERIIEMIDSFGLEQPMIDEQYEIEGDILVSDRDNSGVDFSFGEIDGYSQDGEPVLDQIAFINKGKIKLPFGLEYSDDYKVCCEKLDKKADYYSPYGLETKQWILKTKNNEDYTLAIHFTDEKHSSIRSVVIGRFSTKGIGKVLLENKE
jgi:hypothetical protein